MPLPIAARKALLIDPPVPPAPSGPGQVALFDTVANASAKVVFSNSDMNATGAGTIGSTASSRITTVPLTGLSAYWEWELVNKVSAGLSAGVATLAQDTWLNNYSPNTSACLIANGSFRPTTTDTTPTLVTGNVICCHYKDSTKRMWYQINGTGSFYGSNSTDDPATLTGGSDLSGFAATTYPAISMDGVGDQWRFRAGSNILYTPATGFTVLA